MRRLLVLAIVVLTGCGGQSTTTVIKTVPAPTTSTAADTTSTATETTSTQAARPEPARVGAVLTLASQDTTLEVRVVSVSDPLSVGEYDTPDAGKRYVGVNLVVQNVGSSAFNDSLDNGSTVVLADDQQAAATLVSGGPCGSSFGSDVKIAPGDRRSGCIAFEVPSPTRLRSFQFTADSGFADATGEWDLSSVAPGSSPTPLSSTGSSPTPPSSSGSSSSPGPSQERYVPSTPGGGFVACDGNISAKSGSTTCPFAENVFYEYYVGGQASSITVYSPATGRSFATECSGASSGTVTCTTAAGAAVRFSQSALDSYSEAQAAQYAATHDIGG